MNDNRSPQGLDEVMAALATGTAAEVRTAVAVLLDCGDRDALAEAAAQAERLAPEAADLFDETVEDECQRATREGGRAALFCLPVLVNADRAGPLPTLALLEAVRGARAPGVRVLLVDGWVHQADLLAVDPIGYRATTTVLAGLAAGGVERAPLPGSLFPRFPAERSDASARAEFTARTTANGLSTVRIEARFLVGLSLLPPDAPPGHGLSGLTLDGAAEIGQALCDALETQVAGVRCALEPGQPIPCAVGAAATLQTLVLEARYDILQRTQERPITHFAFDGDVMRVVLADAEGAVLDVLDLCATGLDVEWVSDIITQHSAAAYEHDNPATLPKLAHRALH